MKTNTAMLVDVKLVLSAPVQVQTKRRGYQKAEIDFVSARMKFIDRATSTTWTGTVETARRLHAEAKRVKRPSIRWRRPWTSPGLTGSSRGSSAA